MHFISQQNKVIAEHSEVSLVTPWPLSLTLDLLPLIIFILLYRNRGVLNDSRQTYIFLYCFGMLNHFPSLIHNFVAHSGLTTKQLVPL